MLARRVHRLIVRPLNGILPPIPIKLLTADGSGPFPAVFIDEVVWFFAKHLKPNENSRSARKSTDGRPRQGSSCPHAESDECDTLTRGRPQYCRHCVGANNYSTRQGSGRRLLGRSADDDISRQEIENSVKTLFINVLRLTNVSVASRRTPPLAKNGQLGKTVYCLDVCHPLIDFQAKSI